MWLYVCNIAYNICFCYFFPYTVSVTNMFGKGPEGCRRWRQVKDTSGVTPSSDEERRVLDVVKKRAGVYKDKAAHPEFASVCAPYSCKTMHIFSIYNNWRCNAERHGLDWGCDSQWWQSLWRIGTRQRFAGDWRESKWNEWMGQRQTGQRWTEQDVYGVDHHEDSRSWSCVHWCRQHVSWRSICTRGSIWEIWFAVVSMTMSTKRNWPRPQQKITWCLVMVANTGFFLCDAHATTRRWFSFFTDVVAEVDRQREDAFRKSGERLGADQPIFWQVMQKLRSTQGQTGPGGFKCVRLCKHNPTCKAVAEETLNYCSMNPFSASNRMGRAT